MPRFVIFDLFHTLVPGDDEERDRVVAEMAGMIGVPPAELVRAYHDTWPERITGWDVEQTIRILAERLGAKPTPASVVAAAALRRSLTARILAAVSPATLDLLDRLRASDVRLGLVSNATAETAEAWPHSPLATRFDVAVFSCNIGVTKPDSAIYMAAAAAHGAAPSECVYVGDGADGELAGAAALGMTVFRTAELKDTDPTWPGPRLNALTDLPAAIRETLP